MKNSLKSVPFLKIFFLLGLYLIAFQQHAQAQQPIDIGVLLGPQINYVVVKNRQAIQSKPQLGFVLEGFAAATLANHFSINVGLGFASSNFRTTDNSLVLGSDINPQTGAAVNSTLEETQRYYDVHVPILLKYSLRPDNQGLFIGLGVNNSINFYEIYDWTIVSGSGTVETGGRHGGSRFFQIGAQACVGSIFPVSDAQKFSVDFFGNYVPNRYYAGKRNFLSTGLRLGFWF